MRYFYNIFVIALLFQTSVYAEVLPELDGYTQITTTYITGTFEGADYGKLVKLDNGMIFEFNQYGYFYAYHPKVAVYRIFITPQQQNTVVPSTSDIAIYKLVIENNSQDKAFSVRKIK
ncbi:hypothetical protein [Deinococcus alpinitundrae]|uniref:hypothetical protein n=1 Tax=Deinococcus alpinitundrae TaxID=468913 RepID=UPI00137A1E27|nr:hypothetical protein [Deinococcus alpinitundrae]